MVWLYKIKGSRQYKTLLYRYIAYIDTENIYINFAEDAKKIGRSNYEVERKLPIGKNKKVTRLKKDKLDKKIWQNLLELHRKHILT